MHCTRKITDNLVWVGANDRRLALFEGVYGVPEGVSYNSYLLLDDKTVLFDTSDNAVRDRFLENITHTLNGRKLDYLVLQHIEPDHSALISDVIEKYPDVTLVVNAKSAEFTAQFYEIGTPKIHIVKENDTLTTGKHTLRFFMAAMVHWPEVMVTYDETSKTLFSADAFGHFGALNGSLFADEVNFAQDYLKKMRRYYCNIVGKYGAQTQALLKKMAALDIAKICPLHGFVWRKNLSQVIEPHQLWSSYEPEEKGVMIAYSSVYGNTENAAEIVACRLRENGKKVVMYDASVTHASDIVAEAFRWSHLLFAATTYNNNIFVTMEDLLNDLIAHSIQNRTVAIIENGSWAPASGKIMRSKLEKCKNINIVANFTIKSSLKADKLQELYDFADAINASF
ncbi:MAG: FprA family A-type flavoprotein [Defluviitaleaceae bacterium]|nr:FprA family A-type flavoprotein [Defluviitaleaceae bacterium]